jgi:hypothetical protein
MWFRGKVDPVWDQQFKNFTYARQPLTNDEETKWRASGYTNEHFTGVMYDSTNPMPVWCDDVAKKIGLTNCGFVFYKMSSSVIMPTHVDHYNRYCKVFNLERHQVWRAIVFLEDWKSGHYFEIEQNAIVHYNAGDYVLWSNNSEHAASNIGLEDRYTLQITGQLINA